MYTDLAVDQRKSVAEEIGSLDMSFALGARVPALSTTLAMIPMTVSTMAMAVSARSIPLEGWGMYFYSPYSHLLGNVGMRNGPA